MTDSETVEPARPRFAASHWYALITVLVVAMGGVVIPIVGWVVGIMLLWMSRGWKLSAKIIGTLVVPGGAMAIFIVIAIFAVMPGSTTVCVTIANTAHQTCTTQGPSLLLWLSLGILIVLVAAQIFSSIWVYRKFDGQRVVESSRR